MGSILFTPPGTAPTMASLTTCSLGTALMAGGFTVGTISAPRWLVFVGMTLQDRLPSLRRDIRHATSMENRTSVCNTRGRRTNSQRHGKALADQDWCSQPPPRPPAERFNLLFQSGRTFVMFKAHHFG